MLLDELGGLIGRHAQNALVTIADGVVIAGTDCTGPPTVSTTGTVMVLMVQGAKRMAVGDQVHEYRGGHCMVACVDLPLTGHYTEASPSTPALGFALTLKPAAITELMLHPAAADFSRITRGSAVPPGITVRDAPVALIEAVLRMVRLLDRPRDLPVLAPMIEREILWLLMSGQDGALVRQLGLADSSLNRVGHAVRWLRERYADSIRVDELAQMTHMSPSAFHRTFQAVTSMSPIQFQKQIRLQEARIRLIANPNDVAGAAYAVGYESPSHFSRDYRRRFGAPPAEDAARLRDTALTGGHQ
jgi:AraC-like DNA-binding protein